MVKLKCHCYFKGFHHDKLQPMEIDGQPPIGPAGDDGSKRQPAGSDGSQQVTPIQGAQALTREVSRTLWFSMKIMCP